MAQNNHVVPTFLPWYYFVVPKRTAWGFERQHRAITSCLLLLSFFKGNITERFKYERDIGFISPLFAQEMLQALCFDGLKTLYGFNIIER